ncbi:MAG: class F sortase [Patescibacteria group bacterium]|jgi:LPXTG-site transpeptidase (sortase) family protein
MQSKIPLKWSLFIITSVGVTWSLVIVFFLAMAFSVQASEVKLAVSVSDQVLASAVTGKSVSSVLPTRLQIPKIKVNAVLESVGLTAQGAVGVPKGRVNAAWFNVGPRPGESGNAIITGHYGRWKDGVATVFNNLYKLKKGDKIYIKDKDGATVTFVVRGLKTYGPKDDASNVFIASDNKAHLNIITCVGAWNWVTKSYPKRLVVFTDKE